MCLVDVAFTALLSLPCGILAKSKNMSALRGEEAKKYRWNFACLTEMYKLHFAPSQKSLNA